MPRFSPGYFWNATWIGNKAIQPFTVSFWTEPITHVGSFRLTTIQTRVRLPTHLSLISTGFLVGFKVTAFLFPLSRIDGQSLPWGRRFTSASKGQEFHLHENQVIKDLIGLRPPSLTTESFRRNGSHVILSDEVTSATRLQNRA